MRPSPTDSPDVVEALREAREQCPAVGKEPASNPWHPLLYEGLRDEGLPAVIEEGAITPGGSLWTGARLWTEAFRDTSLRSGDRLVLALPSSTAFVQVLVAALWEGFTIAIATPRDDIDALCDALDARGAVAPQSAPHTWTADAHAGPEDAPDALRPPNTDPTPDVRFLLRTSGTTQLARWIALSDRNVLSVLASHLPHLTLRNARVLSVLPWSHVFGLVLDLFPALLAGAEIIRDPEGGRDPSSLVDLAEQWGATHLSAVPLTMQRLLEHEGGPALLDQLHGGIVGGAPVSGPLADRLSETRLRAGYGQTEAAPGITLGPPGRWAAHYLGRSLGCDVEVADDGELLFEGPNACVGVWRRHEGLDRLDPDRTVRTGDLVRREGDDLFFEGRKGTAFKLSNGRLVRAGAWEGRLKSTYPFLHDALLFTPDGTDLALALCTDRPSDELPSLGDLCTDLGTLGNRLAEVTTVSPEDWIQLPKGTVDRNEMTRRLREADQST
jgi:non-ribosomal peptide synthetase component E (peptide arylation enzyme)